MSQPHPPRPEDQPAQQPSDPQAPRTQEIPVVTPDGEPPTTAPPGPAFSTDASYHPGTPPAPAAAPTPPPAPTPPAPVPPQQMPPPSFPPQPNPPEQAWPQPGTPAPGGDSAWAPRPTGPADFVPGFGTPTPPPAAGSTTATATGQLPAAGRGTPSGTSPGTAPQPPAGPGRSQTAKRLGLRLAGGLHAGSGRDARVFLGLGLGVVGVVLLELGLARDFGNESLWSVVPTWSVFATVAALVALAPLVLGWVPGGPAAATGWRIGAAGVAGLAAFWVLVALPLVASDRGFLLTAVLALAASALWLAPGRAAVGTGTGTTGRSV